MKDRFPWREARRVVPSLLMILVVTCGCEARTSRSVRPPEIVGEASGTDVDRSLTADRYAEKGMPSPDAPWSVREMAAAGQALQAIAQESPQSLPRWSSHRSGALFSRITAVENFASLRDEAVLLDARMAAAGEWLRAPNDILKAYLGAVLSGQGHYETEMLELTGMQLRIMALVVGIADEFRQTLKWHDPRLVIRLAGLQQMKESVAIGLTGGSLVTLTARSVYGSEASVRLLECMQDTFPAIVVHLEPHQRAMILARITELAGNSELERLRPGLIKLHQRVLAVLGFVEEGQMIAASSRKDGEILHRGMLLYQRGSKAEAYRVWLGLAKKGHSASQYNIGVMFADGKGVPANPARAFNWFEKAAEGGYPRAYNALAKFYLNGEVVKKDEARAFALFEKASERGVVEGLYSVAVMTMNGEGVAQDTHKGLASMERAAEYGSVEAQATLGALYLDGEYLARDYQQARNWLGLAARQSHADARYHLGLMHDNGWGMPKSPEQALAYYRMAAAQQHPQALNNLGVMYLNGTVVEHDDRKAAELFRKAFDLGNLNAAVNLGDLYSLGRGVDGDKTKAAEFYRVAAEGDNAVGICRYARALQQGDGVTPNAAEAEALRERARTEGLLNCSGR